MLTLELIKQAAARIAGRVHRTPVIASRSFNEAAGREVFFKCENLQRAGAFKARGATNKILSLSDGEKRCGVIAVSSGNHAQAVALAAREAGIRVVVCIPDDAPKMKVAATRGYGADIRLFNRQKDDREQSIRKGERVKIPPPPTIADGLRVQTPGALTFPVTRANAEAVLTVSDEDIIQTMRFMLFRMKLLVEPSGTAAAAAVFTKKIPNECKRVGIVLSGGNVDAHALSRMLGEGEQFDVA